MKFAIGTILSIIGGLGILLLTPIVIFAALMSGFSSPSDKSSPVFIAIIVPVISAFTIWVGFKMIRSANYSVKSSNATEEE
jgi:threonine/homoserine/homoserine lactone efflux protein